MKEYTGITSQGTCLPGKPLTGKCKTEAICEKGQVFDWRAKLKEDEKDDNPMNKWKKFDTGVKKTVRPPPLKPKPKPSLVPKEDPCTCNVGNCKVHFKFALKSTAKREDSVKVEEPLKRKASIKKN